jgi:hypothetical protein
MQLIRALALCLQLARVSPLTPLHIAGVYNAMTDIPSQSFGSEQKWHCQTDADFLTVFNSTFPLPSQESWTGYHLSSAISTWLTSILQMKVFTVAEWRRLLRPGKIIGCAGLPTSHLWALTHTYKNPHLHTERDCSWDLPHKLELVDLVGESKSLLGRSLAHSRQLERRSLWPKESTQQKWRTPINSSHA